MHVITFLLVRQSGFHVLFHFFQDSLASSHFSVVLQFCCHLVIHALAHFVSLSEERIYLINKYSVKSEKNAANSVN